jgi:hypothetical protein
MARYFFDIKNGHRLIDPAGLDCRDDQEAMDSAAAIARQVAADALNNGPRKISVLNSDRQPIGEVPVNQQQGDQNGGQ